MQLKITNKVSTLQKDIIKKTKAEQKRINDLRARTSRYYKQILEIVVAGVELEFYD